MPLDWEFAMKEAAWAAGLCIQDLCFSGKLKDMCAADLAYALREAIRNVKEPERNSP